MRWFVGGSKHRAGCGVGGEKCWPHFYKHAMPLVVGRSAFLLRFILLLHFLCCDAIIKYLNTEKDNGRGD